ncbi:MAG: carbohydrate kinase family protein, partial [Pirellulaceae bacterium]|nr:carbohydrate kinase family protein [Pirellulaceae bacterium]
KYVDRQIETFLELGAGTVIITLGRNGAIAARGNERWKADAYEVECIDPSGSGDAFDAGLIAGILRGWAMDRTLRFAAALGASATTAVGTTEGIFAPDQADAFIDSRSLDVNHYTTEG